MSARARLAAMGATALACVALAWALAWAGTTTARAVAWLDLARDAVDRTLPHDDLWVRLASVAVRGGFVLLLAGSAVAVVVLARRRQWAAAAALAAVVLGANGTVQAIKHGWLPFVPGVGATLSGHMPVAVGAAVAAWLLVPERWRRRAAAWGAAAVAGAAVVVVVAWHTPFEVLVPTLISAAWALVAPAVARTPAAGAVGTRS